MGVFCTFEGIEGSGKTTQSILLKERLDRLGLKTLLLREPGGTALGEKIRPLLLNDGVEPLSNLAELFLFEASRAQLVERVIRPALLDGAIVICDRFCDSTVAYQGHGRKMDMGVLDRLNSIASTGLLPDVTFLVDLPVEVGLARAISRIGSSKSAPSNLEDRFEKAGIAFHERVRKCFLEIAKKDPKRVRVIDGARDAGAVHKDISDMMDRVLDAL